MLDLVVQRSSGVDHDDELTASGQEFAQAQHERVGHRLRRGSDGISEMRDHAGVDRIGLGESPLAPANLRT